MKRFVLLVAMALCADSAVSNDAKGLDELRVGIERLAMMLKGADDLSGQLPSTDATELSTALRLDYELRAAVFRYNARRVAMCLHRQIAHLTCGPAYLPAWIHEAPDPDPSLKVLAMRKAEIEQRVMPLWEAACGTSRVVAKAILVPDECPIE